MVRQRVGEFRLGFQRRADQGQRFRVSSLAVTDDAQEMQGIEMGGFERQHGAVSGFSGIEPVLLLGLPCLAQGLVELRQALLGQQRFWSSHGEGRPGKTLWRDGNCRAPRIARPFLSVPEWPRRVVRSASRRTTVTRNSRKP